MQLKTFMRYTFGAVALYLGVVYASGLGTVIRAGANGYATGVGALQGRGAAATPARRRTRR